MARDGAATATRIGDLKGAVTRVSERARVALGSGSNRGKYEAELSHWRMELDHLHRWFVESTEDWWGIAPPLEGERLAGSEIWSVNAILTMHGLRPTYVEELQVGRDAFAGQRVLEVGCGPLVPLLQFDRCERHGVDPLASRYVEAGWPLYALDVTVTTAGAESMPYPDGWFDAVVSVNALDHVDDFEDVAAEMTRVLRPGGKVLFEVEYHQPTITEPILLDDRRIERAFSSVDLVKVCERDAAELFAALAARFGLELDKLPQLGSGERYATWHGVLRS